MDEDKDDSDDFGSDDLASGAESIAESVWQQALEDAIFGGDDAPEEDLIPWAPPSPSPAAVLAPPSPSPAAVPAPQSPPLPPPPEPPPSPVPAMPEPPEPLPDVAAADADAVDTEIRLRKMAKWGVFTVTACKAGKGCPYGGYQASCPFHRLGPSSGCKHRKSMPSPSEADKLLTLRALLWWCVQAKDYQRQRTHLALGKTIKTKDSALIPPYRMLLASKITEPPLPGSIRTDAELDALDDATAAGPGSAASSSGGGDKGRGRRGSGDGRGRGRGSARGRGRAVGAAAAGGAAGADAATSSSTSSSSSSSSTGSSD